MFRKSLRFQITAIWLLVNVVIALTVALLVYSTSGGLFRELFLASKLSLASSLARSINGDVHAGFTEPGVVANPEYQRYLAYLNGVKEREAYVTYLYTINLDRASDELYYAIDADIASSDIVWVESEYFALWFYFDEGQLTVAYDQDEYTKDFPSVEIREGASVLVTVEEEVGLPILRLDDVEIARVLQAEPLVVATPSGTIDGNHSESEWEVSLAGQPTVVWYGFSKAGESISAPGSHYVDTPEHEAFLGELIRDGREFVEEEADQDNYGVSLSAYGIIRTAAGEPVGAVLIDFYQRELDAFEIKLRRVVAIVAASAFGIILICSVLVAQYLLVPVKQLSLAVKAITEGKLQTRIPLRRKDEFGQLASGFNNMVESINSNLAGRIEAEAELSQLAYYDQLTGLLNGESFHDRLEQSLALARRPKEGETQALLFLDLDRFKDINDTLGHQVGDRVLRQAADRIAATVRQSDVVFRQGGDEFTVLLTSMHEDADAGIVGEKLVGAFSEPIVVEANTLHVGLSIGIAMHPKMEGPRKS